MPGPMWNLAQALVWTNARESPGADALADQAAGLATVISLAIRTRSARTPAEAWREIAAFVDAGRLRATGRPGPNYETRREREAIVNAADLSPDSDSQGGLFLSADGGADRHWFDVQIDRDALLQLLPGSRQYRTGSAGRPTSKNLWLAEARRRLESGELPPSKAAFAEDLSAWLARAHPGAPPVKAKTISNDIGELWRGAKARAQIKVR